MATVPVSYASPMIFTKDEATAAERTWLFHLTKAADGTDCTGVVPVATISKAGGAFGAVNGATAITELTNGWYKIVHAAADLDTVGALGVRIAVATADTLCVVHQVTRLDFNKSNPAAISSDQTAQAGANTTVTLAAGESAVDHFLEGALVRIVGGTGAGQTRLVTGYVGATKVATVDRAWATNPDNTSIYELLATNPVGVDPVTLKDASLKAATFSTDGLAAAQGKTRTVGPTLKGTLTATVTSVAQSMKNAIDATVILAGTFNGATVLIETTEDPTASSPVWTDRSSGGLTGAGQLVLTGPHSAWRARVSAGAVTSVTVKSTTRFAGE